MRAFIAEGICKQPQKRKERKGNIRIQKPRNPAQLGVRVKCAEGTVLDNGFYPVPRPGTEFNSVPCFLVLAFVPE
jgi:hypothetical protein